MNQIHEDDWAEDSWAIHSGMLDGPASPERPTIRKDTLTNKAIAQLIEISKENGYSDELIAEITGLTIAQLKSL